MCDNEKSKMCTRYFNFLDRQYGGCLSHEPTILAPMHDPLHLQQHCQREGVGGGGGGGTEREQNFPKCFKVFV